MDNNRSICNSPKSPIINNEPLPGQTESSITIGNQRPNDRIENFNRKNASHIVQSNMNENNLST